MDKQPKTRHTKVSRSYSKDDMAEDLQVIIDLFKGNLADAQCAVEDSDDEAAKPVISIKPAEYIRAVEVKGKLYNLLGEDSNKLPSVIKLNIKPLS